MAVNSPNWSKGEVKLFKSSGTTVTPIWSLGESVVRHEYVAGGEPPTYRRRVMIG